MIMYTKEDFNKVWKDSSREDILNQFYYEHKDMEKFKNIINELEKYLDEQVDYMTHHSIERMVAFDCCRHKLQELKGSKNND